MSNNTSPEIYFACSIRGGRNDAESYAKLVDYIKTEATVLTEIFADGKLTALGMNKPNEAIWKTDTNWIKQADAVIAEVTNPSLGVGYEIAKAEEWGKPVLALFREDGDRTLSAMIAGSPETKVVTYTHLDEAYKAIDNFVRSLK
jgi:nucleoside 2-deoxyribosyltransferase